MQPVEARQEPPDAGFTLSPSALEDVSNGIRAAMGWLTAHVRGEAEASLTRFVALAAQVVPHAESGTLVQFGAGRGLLAYSGTAALQVDRYQCRIGEGPAVLAANRFAVIRVHDLPSDQRWPRYGRHAAALGLLSALCVPAAIRADAPMVLTVFSRRRAAFGRRADETALLLGEVLTTGFTVAASLLTRVKLEQAAGIVMAENRCTAEEALQDLRASAAHQDVPLDVLAEQVASRAVQPWDDRFPRHECRVGAAS